MNPDGLFLVEDTQPGLRHGFGDGKVVSGGRRDFGSRSQGVEQERGGGKERR
jgi:hypothetical protein